MPTSMIAGVDHDLAPLLEGEEWIADSGSTFHTSGDPRLMFNFQRVPIEQSRLAIANGIALNVLGKGSIHLIMHAQTNFPLTLHDVLLVENMRFNLFSL
ncbi:unnamed protein product, partial [Hapterophycus canaliculatus]